MTYRTPSLALIAKLTHALGLLSDECETNQYFAVEHASEVEALGAANAVQAEAEAFLTDAQVEDGVELVLDTVLTDWEQGNDPRPHRVQVTLRPNALDVMLWPAEKAYPVGGLGVICEVNQGMAAMHLASAELDGNIVHVHERPDESVELVREVPQDAWKDGPSVAYPTSTAMVWVP